MTVATPLAVVGGQIGGSASSLTVNRPGSGVPDTAYGIVVAACGNNSGSMTVAGYTTLLTPVQVAGSRWGIFGKVVGTDTNVVVNWPSALPSGNNYDVAWAFYSGTTGVGQIGSTTVGPTGTVSTCASITTTGPDRLVVSIGLCTGGSGGFASSVSWGPTATVQGSQFATGNFYSSISLATQAVPTTGTATGAQSATWNFSTANLAGVQLSLQPSVLDLAVSSVTVTPSTMVTDGSATVSSTINVVGGIGGTKTYKWDWGDGTTTGYQSSNTATHAYGAVTSDTDFTINGEVLEV